MAMITWVDEPPRSHPSLVTAFTGWNDAGDAASGALAWLASRWETTEVATLDPEPFYDFADTRPRLRLHDDGSRSLIWPSNDLMAAAVTGADTPDGNSTEVALLVGTEPQLKWKTFTQQIVDMAQRLDSPLVVTLGALLADVPHTRPTPIYGSSDDPEMASQLGLTPSRYEGPTGIVGVLHNACATAGLRTASLWAAVPGYASEIPSPKASLALVRRLGTLLDISPDTSELEEMAEGYERHVSELADQVDETNGYIAQLESAYDQHEAESGEIEQMRSTDPTQFVSEIEQFLRNQRN
ncbi:MAG: PAC2 family protein [bacterium]|nr:PAC2 family protein [bacterium]